MTSTKTIQDTGWTRTDGNTMQYVGPKEPFGRDIMQLLVRRRQDTARDVVILKVGSLDTDQDPADSETLAEEFEFAAACELNRDALLVLTSALGTVLHALPEE